MSGVVVSTPKVIQYCKYLGAAVYKNRGKSGEKISKQNKQATDLSIDAVI